MDTTTRNNMIASQEAIVTRCDAELASERKRTKPNPFLINAREHERGNALRMLRRLAEEV